MTLTLTVTLTMIATEGRGARGESGNDDVDDGHDNVDCRDVYAVVTARMIFSVMMAVMIAVMMRISNLQCIMTMAITTVMKIRMMIRLATMVW